MTPATTHRYATMTLVRSFATAALWLGVAGTSHAQLGPVPVSVATVVQRKVSSGQTFVSNVMPVRHSVVGSAVDGRVIEFSVNEGDYVKKDQVLAQLRTDALEIQVAAAKANWELAKQELAELENGTRPEEIAQAKARMLGAKATMDYRMSRHKRMRELIQRGASSADELQDSASAAELAAQFYQEAKVAWQLAVLGPRKEKVLQAKARVAYAFEEVNRLQDIQRKHTIVSPFDGYVVGEFTEIGQWISQAASVAEIAEVSRVDIEAQVLESYVPHLRVGMEARVEISALPGQTFIGEVASIVPRADLKSRGFPVKVRLTNKIENGLPLLKPGMFARVTLPIGKVESATMVPKDALVLGGPSPVVFVVDQKRGSKSATVRVVPVQLGVVDADMVQVKGQLAAGARVVVSGNERLMPNQEVIVIQEQQPGRPVATTASAER